MPTLLHVDNSAVFHRVVKELADEKGLDYVASKTKKKALEILENHDVDLIITGKALQGASGEEFIEEI